MMRVMGRLASFFAVIAVVLFGFAALSLWQLKRARRELTEREVQAARAADEDKLTGLSNHGKTLELLDLAFAERRDEDWTTFALIELDGMEDVTEAGSAGPREVWPDRKRYFCHGADRGAGRRYRRDSLRVASIHCATALGRQCWTGQCTYRFCAGARSRDNTG
jgi:hypothetical protein